MDPKQIARYQAEKVRNATLIRDRKIEEQRNVERVIGGGFYHGYNAETERHVVRTVTGEEKQVEQVLTNAGLNAGDPVELNNGAMDAMPRIKPQDEDDETIIDPDAIWGALLMRRAYVTTVSVYKPGREAVYSDPVPASWLITFYSATQRGGYRDDWDPSFQRRYATIYSVILCGSLEFSDPISNFNNDSYCRYNTAGWTQIPDEFIHFTGAPYSGCAFGFAAEAGGTTYDIGGLVIGTMAFSPDGQEAEPSLDDLQLPTIYQKLENPDYVGGGSSLAWLSCDEGYGDEVDMGWTPLETTKYSDYVPPRELMPAVPAGTEPVDRFETQYWLVTAAGVTKVLTVQDYEDPTLEYPEWYAKTVQALLAVDEYGVFHLDFTISEPDFSSEEGGTLTEVKHLQVQGGAITTVEQSRSWRSNTAFHPCVNSYKTNPWANIDTSDPRLIRVNPVELSTLEAGQTVTANIWRLLASETCSLSSEPNEQRDIILTPFSTTSIGVLSKDQGTGVVGFAAYV